MSFLIEQLTSSSENVEYQVFKGCRATMLNITTLGEWQRGEIILK